MSDNTGIPRNANYEVEVKISFLYDGVMRNETRNYYYRTYENVVESFYAKNDFLKSEFEKGGINAEVEVNLYKFTREKVQ